MRTSAPILRNVRLTVGILILGFTAGSSFLPRSGGDDAWTRLTGWSRQAEILTQHENTGAIQYLDCPVYVNEHGKKLSLSSPRDWLEYWPDGAYTVIRCDLHRSDSTPVWKILGLAFHLQRLEDSFLQYADLRQREYKSIEHLDCLQQQGERLLRSLLHLAETDFGSNRPPSDDSTAGPTSFMVTLLCHPHQLQHFTIRGHICVAGQLNSMPASTVVSIGLDQQNSRPHRQLYSAAKLSRWCTDRRMTEELYKTTEDISEVILVQPRREIQHESQQSSDTVPNTQLLEGLTSNLFVIRCDNVLQTANENVLHGYARQLVLEQAARMGLSVELSSPRLEESSLWHGVFLTSSIRLLVPVHKIVIPSQDGENDEMVIWSAERSHPLCARLYETCIDAGVAAI